MKRYWQIMMTVAVLGGVLFTSCKEKDKPEPQEPTEETATDTKYDEHLSEGVFQPAYRIANLYHDDAIYQTWEWGTSKLASVEDAEEMCTYEFSYSGDQVSAITVTYEDGKMESLNFGYNGLLTRVEIAEGNMTTVVMGVSHNANDQVTNVSLDYSDDYIIDMATSQLLGKSVMSHVLSRSAMNGIVEMSKMLNERNAKNGAKYTVTNKHFALVYTWNGDNLVREELSGNFSAMATINDVANIFNLGQLAAVASYFANDSYPMSYTVESRTDYTFDGKVNPTRYYWGKGIAPSNLSKNNVLTATTEGRVEMAVTVTLPDSLNSMVRMAILSLWDGNTQHTYTREKDLSDSETHTYKYNSNNYLTSDACNGTVTKYKYK